MIIALQTLVFFRESLLSSVCRLLQPYYKTILSSLRGEVVESDDDESEEDVFAEFDEEKGVVFYPPMYVQRYAAVADCLMDERWSGKLEKIVDFGYHDMSFLKYLKEVPGVHTIIGVDIETLPLRCSSDLLGCDDYSPKRESPLQVTLFQGNAADPDYRLIGCDAVVSIEMIEHMLPHDLERFVHTVFGFVKPWIAIFTTPNGDFNTLFKALEKNGLRRWDHFFEWTREQFNDWCSNIVLRYPNYTVVTQGIGPGPPGTEHYGCCSQLALFVSKDYHKQQNLDLNSLAVVANAPIPGKLSEMMSGWDVDGNSTSQLNPEPTLEPSISATSYTEFQEIDQESHTTIVLAPLTHSLPSSVTCRIEPVTYSDKTLQCNIDNEISKSFLMFDDNPYLDIVVPRRITNHRIYEIGDVTSRLNCSTFLVNKFSKSTRSLMARNKMDALLHTREVVDEIRQLTNNLNFDKQFQPLNGNHIWYNINWGENAPYWNQYYKVVRDYNCPFETKSEECRILELVSDEINHLVDSQYEDDEFSVDMNRLEIPLIELMPVVQHITDDIDRVRDILEWNGYEIVDDVLIHTRLVVDCASVATHDDCQDTETLSDLDTADVRSTTVSDGSTIVPDYHERSLRRALDVKMRNLRAMLTADEDITTELDKVVCRLMKLALRTSNGRQTPPPTRWMQCKLLDMLTLTEKAIERRKKYFIESYPFSEMPGNSGDMSPLLQKIRKDNTADDIMNKYEHLIMLVDMTPVDDSKLELNEEDNYLQENNDYLKDCDYDKTPTPSIDKPPDQLKDTVSPRLGENLERTMAWLDDDAMITPPDMVVNYDEISSGDIDHGMTRPKHKQKKFKKRKTISDKDVKEIKEAAQMIVLKNSQSKREEKSKKNKGSTGVNKKVAWKKSSHSGLKKKNPSSYQMRRYTQSDNVVTSILQRSQEQLYLNLKATKPIPESLINLCRTEYKADRGEEEYTPLSNVDIVDDSVTPKSEPSSNISATERSNFVDIITINNVETIALQRTIGTDAEIDTEVYKNINDSVCNDLDINLHAKHQVSTEHVQSQTIFLNDINEPSTSKGIRHNVSMDVQCGPDPYAGYSLQAPSPSLAQIPQAYSMGIKINDAGTDAIAKVSDFSASTHDNNLLLMESRTNFAGIKIKDSDVAFDIGGFTTHATSTVELTKLPTMSVNVDITSKPKLNNPECCVGNFSQTCTHVTNFTETPPDGFMRSVSVVPSAIVLPSDILMECTSKAHGLIGDTCNKLARPRLLCGGIHVHSYKDNCVSEDIVFQGGWQKYRTKIIAKRKSISSIVSRKKKDSLIEKKGNLKDTNKKQLKSETKGATKKVPLQTAKSIKSNLDTIYISKVTKPVLIKANVKEPSKPITIFNKAATINPAGCISSKHVKTSYTIKKTVIPVYTAPYTNTESEKSQKTEKNYMPLYLKRKLRTSSLKEKHNLNKSIDSASINKHEQNMKEQNRLLKRSNTDEIRSVLLNNFSDDLRKRLSYVVFRNELEDKHETNENKSLNDNVLTNNNQLTENSNMPLFSPQSFNSSTCSSPNSVATVKAVGNHSKNEASRRHSESSAKSNIITSDSDNNTPAKIKKITRRSKSAKKINNKENVPQSTRSVASGKETDKLSKSPFVGRHKNVYVVQTRPDGTSEQSLSTTVLPKQKLPTPHKLIIKNSPYKQTYDRRTSSPTLSKKKSMKSKTSLASGNVEHKLGAHDDFPDNVSYTVRMFESDNKEFTPETEGKIHILPILPIPTIAKNDKITEWLEQSRSQNQHTFENEQCSKSLISAENLHSPENLNSMENIHTNLAAAMKKIVENALDFLDSSYDVEDSETVILSRKNSKIVTSHCPLPIKENVANYKLSNRTTKFDSEFETDSNPSLTGAKTVEDSDLLSFKSVTSVSKYSEYFLADNDLAPDQSREESPIKHMSSIQDIFERKDAHFVQKTPGVLAVQAFSGFSFSELAARDRPDPIALIDSETGSRARVARQATSEELFVSGRSSGSYQSCVLDEDAVVPTWLFEMISQHQNGSNNSANTFSSRDDDSEPVMYGPLAPLYDENGNPLDPGVVGYSVTAGAGDGCGMHSDNSQQTSGQGSSLSSSATSSGPQSQAILLDPSAFTAQLDLVREAVTGDVLAPDVYQDTSSESTFRLVEEERIQIQITLPNGASDVDADVSSLGTDVPDSSDN